MTLHLYAQEMWHDEAYIAGAREDLEELRNAINRALADGRGEMRTFASDGEGYTIHVVAMTDERADKMPVPYTDEIAKSKPEQLKYGPWAVVLGFE